MVVDVQALKIHKRFLGERTKKNVPIGLGH